MSEDLITVNVQGIPVPLKFPVGTDPAVIDRAVQEAISTNAAGVPSWSDWVTDKAGQAGKFLAEKAASGGEGLIKGAIGGTIGLPGNIQQTANMASESFGRPPMFPNRVFPTTDEILGGIEKIGGPRVYKTPENDVVGGFLKAAGEGTGSMLSLGKAPMVAGALSGASGDIAARLMPDQPLARPIGGLVGMAPAAWPGSAFSKPPMVKVTESALDSLGAKGLADALIGQHQAEGVLGMTPNLTHFMDQNQRLAALAKMAEKEDPSGRLAALTRRENEAMGKMQGNLINSVYPDLSQSQASDIIGKAQVAERVSRGEAAGSTALRAYADDRIQTIVRPLYELRKDPDTHLARQDVEDIVWRLKALKEDRQILGTDSARQIDKAVGQVDKVLEAYQHDDAIPPAAVDEIGKILRGKGAGIEKAGGKAQPLVPIIKASGGTVNDELKALSPETTTAKMVAQTGKEWLTGPAETKQLMLDSMGGKNPGQWAEHLAGKPDLPTRANFQTRMEQAGLDPQETSLMMDVLQKVQAGHNAKAGMPDVTGDVAEGSKSKLAWLLQTIGTISGNIRLWPEAQAISSSAKRDLFLKLSKALESGGTEELEKLIQYSPTRNAIKQLSRALSAASVQGAE